MAKKYCTGNLMTNKETSRRRTQPSEEVNREHTETGRIAVW